MKRSLLTIALCALSACGGFENEPFKVGVVRGQLGGTIDSTALVAVVGRQDLVTRPDATGRFELRNVPIGPVDLLVVTNLRESQRLSVTVGGASIVELYLSAEGGHALTNATISLVGTPFTSGVSPFENEAEFFVPAGCYDAHVVVRGLGETTVQGCVTEGGLFERRVNFGLPDGTEGREGCAVTGCEDGLTCQADRSCR
jgi:hypothetical protein